MRRLEYLSRPIGFGRIVDDLRKDAFDARRVPVSVSISIYGPTAPVTIAVVAAAPDARFLMVYAFTAAISGSLTVAVI